MLLSPADALSFIDRKKSLHLNSPKETPLFSFFQGKRPGFFAIGFKKSENDRDRNAVNDYENSD